MKDVFDFTRREVLQASAALAVLPSIEAAGGTTTAAKYVLTRLSQHGVDHLFGVPGATCDPLFAAATGKPAALVCSSDLEAGYAADGYARVRGLGAVSVTYGVGMMGLMSVVSGAYAERVPVVVINGGPSAEDLRVMRETGSFFSHSNGREDSDLKMFREITVAAVRVESAADVPKVVDELIRTALTKKRPVYLEVPKHLWDAACPAPSGAIDVSAAPSGEEEKLAAAIAERLSKAKQPVVLLGVEVARLGLSARAAALVEKLALSWSTTLLGKSVIAETTAGFAGVYSGEHALPAVKNAVEEADVILALGCVWGRQYRHLVTKAKGGLLSVSNGQAKLGKAAPVTCSLPALLDALGKLAAGKPGAATSGLAFENRRATLGAPPIASASAEDGLTYDEVMRAVSDSLDDKTVAVTDTSLSMYPAAELEVHGANAFICNSVWQAIGYSVAAAVGVAMAQDKRVVAICGDGGFQMTAQSLSTMAKRKLPVTVVVLDNSEYGIEQWLLEPKYFADPNAQPRPYLSLNRWDYAALARALGFTSAVTVKTAAELTKALATKGQTFICATVKPHDLPSQLRKA